MSDSDKKQEGEKKNLLNDKSKVIVTIGVLVGMCIMLIGNTITPDSNFWGNVLINIGATLMATSLISIFLDIVWVKERSKIEDNELKKINANLESTVDSFKKLEFEMTNLRNMGLKGCTENRDAALHTFYKYAEGKLRSSNDKSECGSKADCKGTIKIVSSSASGLIGLLDKDNFVDKIHYDWRKLIEGNPKNFKMLLTHPSYAYLRQPAERRTEGQIELEILKTAIYLLCIGMKSEELRFYRGSPTVFMIQVDDHILLNPYPYGTMASNALCLEVDAKEGSAIQIFTKKHFSDTWSFYNQYSKQVNGQPLVEGVDTLDDILEAFSKCTVMFEAKKLRVNKDQVRELDEFYNYISKSVIQGDNKLKEQKNPFQKYVYNQDIECIDGKISKDEILDV